MTGYILDFVISLDHLNLQLISILTGSSRANMWIQTCSPFIGSPLRPSWRYILSLPVLRHTALPMAMEKAMQMNGPDLVTAKLLPFIFHSLF